ncbi:uncharacterized protein [Dysidea avara]|uniref:uncharacterized protein isoform X2 n=1 Tax=Dysidea avara TaxID=196820 RepID=UPI00331AF73F
MLQQSLRRIYPTFVATVTVLMVYLYWWQESEVDTIPYYNPNGDQLILRQVENFSLGEQLGNKSRINDIHLPVEGNWCGDNNVWNNYAIFHRDVLRGHRKGNGYLRYYCRPTYQRCGGYGNRIQAITVALIMAMLTDRVFLMEMTYPLQLLDYLGPNAISPTRISRYWLPFAEDLLSPSGPELIEFRSNEGFEFFYPQMLKSPVILERFLSLGVSNRTHFASLYGCTTKFLFRPRPITSWSVMSQLSSLGLTTGKYVAVHIRTSLSSLDCGPRHATPESWAKFLQCALLASERLAKLLGLDYTLIYVASDEDVVKEFALRNYGERVVLSQVYTLHVDRPRVDTPQLLHEGFLGMLSDMEVLSRAAILIKSHSTFSDVIEGLGLFLPNESFIVNDCPYT